MEVNALLQQLQKALEKPTTNTVATQTIESYDDIDVDKTTFDAIIEVVQAKLDELKDGARKRKARPDFQEPLGKQPRIQPVNTPQPLTLQLPPSVQSGDSFHTEDAVFNFDECQPDNENRLSPEVDSFTPFNAVCPKCQIMTEGYMNVREVFGVKDVKGKQRPQSWCKKCRSKHRVDDVTSPPSSETLLPYYSGKESETMVFDDSTQLINRRGSIFCISQKEPTAENGSKRQGFHFHDTIKKLSESWEQAELRHRENSHPIIKKRSKLLSILSRQEGKPMAVTMQKYEGKTTMELFCKIKQESPMLLKPLCLP